MLACLLVILCTLLCLGTGELYAQSAPPVPSSRFNIPTDSLGNIYPITARTGEGSTCTAATLNAAIAALGSARVNLPLSAQDGTGAACTWVLEEDVNIPENIHLMVTVPLTVAEGKTLTFNSCPVVMIGEMWYTGTVGFNNCTRIESWWGAASASVPPTEGGGVDPPVAGAPGDGTWTIIGTGDFNNDGYADILWRHSGGSVAIWLMAGGRVLSAGVPGAAGTDWAILNVGDYNGDGKDDLLWEYTVGSTNGTERTHIIWYMNGAAILGSDVVHPTTAAPTFPPRSTILQVFQASDSGSVRPTVPGAMWLEQ